MRQLAVIVALFGLLTYTGGVQADDGAGKKQKPAATSQPESKQAYLGLEVQTLPPALSSQMPGIFPKGQGVLIARIGEDSPAAKAGLQAYDILMSYGDQKLYSPDQLTKLVRGDRPGHEVAITFMRGGKSETCKVMLGERASPLGQAQPPVFRMVPDERFQQLYEEFQSKHGTASWELLDGLKLTRLDAKRWRAEVEYRSKDGKQEHKKFEGTRDEIRKDIQGRKDLPANERAHLLRALNLDEPVFEFRFPPFDRIGPEF